MSAANGGYTIEDLQHDATDLELIDSLTPGLKKKLQHIVKASMQAGVYPQTCESILMLLINTGELWDEKPLK